MAVLFVVFDRLLLLLNALGLLLVPLLIFIRVIVRPSDDAVVLTLVKGAGPVLVMLSSLVLTVSLLVLSDELENSILLSEAFSEME